MKRTKDILGDYLPVVFEGDAVFLSIVVVGGFVVVNIRARSLTDKPKYQVYHLQNKQIFLRLYCSLSSGVARVSPLSCSVELALIDTSKNGKW